MVQRLAAFCAPRTFDLALMPLGVTKHFFEQLFTNLGVKSQGTKWIIFLYLQDEILNVYVVTISARVTYPSLCCPHAEEIGADNSV